jgi:hypothetical protein
MKAAYQAMREKNKRGTCYTKSNMRASLVMAEILNDEMWLGGERVYIICMRLDDAVCD